MFWNVSGAAMSKLSTGVAGLAASKTRTQPPAPVIGGRSKNNRSGASVQTPVASLAGNIDVTCSSGTTATASTASVPDGASAITSGSTGASEPPAPPPPPASPPGDSAEPPQPTPTTTIETRIHVVPAMAIESPGAGPTAQPNRIT